MCHNSFRPGKVRHLLLPPVWHLLLFTVLYSHLCLSPPLSHSPNEVIAFSVRCFVLPNKSPSIRGWLTHTHVHTNRAWQTVHNGPFICHPLRCWQGKRLDISCVCACVCMYACMHACACYIDSSPFIWLIIHQVFQLDSSFILKHTHTYMRTECGHRHINLHTI